MAFHGFLPGTNGIKKYPGYTYLPLKLGTGDDAIFVTQNTLPIPKPRPRPPRPPRRPVTFKTHIEYLGRHQGEVRMILGDRYWLWSDQLKKRILAKVGDLGVQPEDLGVLKIGSRVSFDVISERRKKRVELYAEDVRCEPNDLEEIVDFDHDDMQIDGGKVYEDKKAEIKYRKVDKGKGKGKMKEKGG